MKITAPWLSSAESQRITRLLTEAGHQAWFVGGCVRNSLLQVAVSDLDLSTDAHPERVMDLAKHAAIAAHPTGIDHGTVTLVLNGAAFEVTTFRRDVATDGRRAVVAFAETLNEDAQRRDFTMNALYVDAAGHVQDPTGGLDDLAARQFRFIGSAENRIREDTLRILRFFRFHAWYGRDLDPEGLAACAALSDGLSNLSAERVTAELIKLLSAPNPAPSVAAMSASGVLTQVLPGADANCLTRYVHFEDATQAPVNPILRLAALGADAEIRLKLSNAQKRLYTAALEAISNGQGAAALGQTLGAPLARDVINLRAAVFETPPLPGDFQAAQKGGSALFPVKAADLPPDLKGRDIGKALKELKAQWIASDFVLTKDQLLARL